MCCRVGNECWSLGATGQPVVCSIVEGLWGKKEREQENKDRGKERQIETGMDQWRRWREGQRERVRERERETDRQTDRRVLRTYLVLCDRLYDKTMLVAFLDLRSLINHVHTYNCLWHHDGPYYSKFY